DAARDGRGRHCRSQSGRQLLGCRRRRQRLEQARQDHVPHPRGPAGRGALTMWRASVLTIFPEVFSRPLGASLAGKALAAGPWSLAVADIRSFATDKHRSVDDTPAGGGPGMVMKADVLARAVDAVAEEGRPRLLLSPRGASLTQGRVEN